MEEMSQLDDITRGMFLATKAMDLTRPVLDTSGYSHRIHETDVYDCHDYTQDPEKFAEHHSHVGEGNPYQNEWRIKGPHLRDYRGRASQTTLVNPLPRSTLLCQQVWGNLLEPGR